MMAITSAPDDHVSAAEASIALAMSRERLVRQIQAGKLRGMSVKGFWFVHKSELPKRHK